MANLAAHLIHEPYHHLTCFIRNAYRLILMSLKSNKETAMIRFQDIPKMTNVN